MGNNLHYNLPYNLDFDITRLFRNTRLSENLKTRIKLRLFESDNIINKYGLSPFLSGLATFEEIEHNIPQKVTIYDKEYTSEELKNTLLNLSLIQDQEKIKEKISQKITALLKDKFDSEEGVFNFIDVRSEPTMINSKNCISKKTESIPKVWINTLCVFVLIKWQIYTQSRDKTLVSSIEKSIKWLNENKEVYGWFEYCKGTSNIIKLFETTITLQALLRASKLDYKLDEINFNEYAKKILALQKHSHNGSWPSEIIISSDKKITNYRYDGDIGATSYTIHFLDEFLGKAEDDQLKKRISYALRHGYRWLISKQNNGYWEKNNKDSIDYTTNAIQALIKCGKYFKDDNKLKDSIYKGLEWLGDKFCLEVNNDIIYAYPKDEDDNIACEKNTAFVVTTLLKASIPNDSFIVRKAMLWLLDAKPQFEFDEIYIYCAMLEYLRSLAPNYNKVNFPFNHSI